MESKGFSKCFSRQHLFYTLATGGRGSIQTAINFWPAQFPIREMPFVPHLLPKGWVVVPRLQDIGLVAGETRFAATSRFISPMGHSCQYFCDSVAVDESTVLLWIGLQQA